MSATLELGTVTTGGGTPVKTAATAMPMTTAIQEYVQELRTDLANLREAVQGLADSEAGIRGALLEVQNSMAAGAAE